MSKRGRLAGLFAAAALVTLGLVMWITNELLTQRYTETLAGNALDRSTQHARAVTETVQTYSMAATLMARDQRLVSGLTWGAPRDRLMPVLEALQEQAAVEALFLYSPEGDLRAATAPPRINHPESDHFAAARSAEQAVFVTLTLGERDQGFYFSRRIRNGDMVIGILVSRIALSNLEESWTVGRDQVFVTSADDIILMSTRDDWRFRALAPFLDAAQVPPGVARRNLLPMLNIDTEGAVPRVVVEGVEYLRVTRPLDFRGWQMTYLAPMADAQARVNTVLALEVMAFAMLAAIAFFVTARRAARESLRMRQESDALRALNTRLTQEMEERMRVEQSLEIAEKSLEQSSKLAALGQMSAAIAHELNQPLAAMKTYIAGAQLLLRRQRTQEAEASFQRIDDLITRMNALTQQLKSFARKGGEDFKVVDMRTVCLEALSIMSPQLNQRNAAVMRRLPEHPVPVRADPLRLEQILINLMRNALDATRGQTDAAITLEVLPGARLAIIQVRDNGPGLEGDPARLFEPFYTTKKAGDGVGLGLAISAQIAGDLGGTLTARNGARGGAVFELSLPRADAATGDAA